MSNFERTFEGQASPDNSAARGIAAQAWQPGSHVGSRFNSVQSGGEGSANAVLQQGFQSCGDLYRSSFDQVSVRALDRPYGAGGNGRENAHGAMYNLLDKAQNYYSKHTLLKPGTIPCEIGKTVLDFIGK